MRVRASSLNYRDVMVLKSGGHGPTKAGVIRFWMVPAMLKRSARGDAGQGR
jgi:hypothetical protein